MVTSLEEIQNVLSGNTSSVTTAQLPEAEIDVRGGVGSTLETSGVNPKKKKKKSLTLGSSQTADMLQNLIDDVTLNPGADIDWSNVDVVNEFKDSAIELLNNPSTGPNIQLRTSEDTTDPLRIRTPRTGDIGGGIGIGSPTVNVPSVTTPSVATPSVEGINQGVSGQEIDDFHSLSPGAQRSALSIMGNIPGTAVGLSRGISVSDMAKDIAMGAALNSPVGAAYRTGMGVESFLDRADVSTPMGALNTFATAYGLAQGANKAYDYFSTLESVEQLTNDATKGITSLFDGIAGIVSNPEAAIQAMGLGLQYGTTSPNINTFNLPSGQVSFTFDSKGNLATPGIIGSLMVGPIGIASPLSKAFFGATGYKDMINARAHEMVAAFSNPGVEYTSGITSFTNAGKSFADVNLDSYPGLGHYSTQIDIDAIGKGVNIGALTAAEVDQAAVVQAFVAPEDLEYYTEAVQDRFAETAIYLGLAKNMTEAYNVSTDEISAAMQSFNASINADVNEAITAGFQNQYGIDLTAWGAVGPGAIDWNPNLHGIDPKALTTSSLMSRAHGIDPALAYDLAIQGLSMMPGEELGWALDAYGRELASDAIAQNVLSLGSFDGRGYNSADPDSNAVNLAEQVMDLTGKNTFMPEFNEEDRGVANVVSGAVTSWFDPMGEGAHYGMSSTGGKGTGVEGPAVETDVEGYNPKTGAPTGTSTEGIDTSGIEDPGPAYAGLSEDEEAGGGSSGGDSGNGDKVVCTELYRQNLLPEDIWKYDDMYGKTVPLAIKEGYWSWGRPLAKLMARSKTVTSIVKPVATCVAKEMAYRAGYGQGSRVGAILLSIGLPICSIISRVNKNGNYRTAI